MTRGVPLAMLASCLASALFLPGHSPSSLPAVTLCSGFGMLVGGPSSVPSLIFGASALRVSNGVGAFLVGCGWASQRGAFRIAGPLFLPWGGLCAAVRPGRALEDCPGGARVDRPRPAPQQRLPSGVHAHAGLPAAAQYLESVDVGVAWRAGLRTETSSSR